jgi:hypothetical protein
MKKTLLLFLLCVPFISNVAFSQCGQISLIGEFNSWSGDLVMTPDQVDPNLYSVTISLTKEMAAGDNLVKMKFRQNGAWTVNWGAIDFPTGIGTQDGPDIPVPIDTNDLTTAYFVRFNCTTGEYIFTEVCGMIGLVGEFNSWGNDQFMMRSPGNTYLWTTTLVLNKSMAGGDDIVKMKFRENAAWTVNWGGGTFPEGIGTQDGPDISVPIDTAVYATVYFVTFDCFTGAYSFTETGGQIGMIGEFNSWAGDIMMTPSMYAPYLWTGNLSFTKEMAAGDDIVKMKFRENATWTVNWGGSTFPAGVGTQDGPDISVPIDTNGFIDDYFVTFNSSTGDYLFVHNSVIAPKTSGITLDGVLNEADWKITEPVTQVVSGTLTGDLNEVHFGVTYDADNLYIGINVKDALPTIYEMGEVFIDGDNSGGTYDANDLHLRFNGPVVTIVYGPSGIVTPLGFALTADGYSAELGIPLADLNIDPATVQHIGFDIIVGDGDSGTGVDYMLAWSGGLQNYTSTSSFGKLYLQTYADIWEINDQSNFVTLFPNPSTSNVYLQLTNKTFVGNTTIFISDVTGRMLVSNEYNIENNNDLIELNASGLSQGIYFVNLISQDGAKAVKRLIVR